MNTLSILFWNIQNQDHFGYGVWGAMEQPTYLKTYSPLKHLCHKLSSKSSDNSEGQTIFKL
jgi:hypothetical protein